MRRKENPLRICIVQPAQDVVSETFIRAHAARLPAEILTVHGHPPRIGNAPVLAQGVLPRLARKSLRAVRGKPWEWEITSAYLQSFRRFRADAVLAEYGTTGTRVMEACSLSKLPLIVHFHGADASSRTILEEFAHKYTTMFEIAAAIIVVSREMKRTLLQMGAPEEKLRFNPYGVNCSTFEKVEVADAPPSFVAVGRFVEKKAPHVTLMAFERVHQVVPSARLRMIGDGPLLAACKHLAIALRLENAVTFLGPQSHEVVGAEMRQARAFVQHSIEASDGDREGLPLAVLEAGASGLPVVSTKHAGIPDIVISEETGFLVDELDLTGMSDAMLRIARSPDLAGKLGDAARKRIEAHFSIEHSISGLHTIILSTITANRPSRAITFSSA